MMKRSHINIVERHEHILAVLLLVLGFALRLSALGQAPYGLNQDEASAGYDAWALLHYGIDRNGMSWPVLFVSWGSGQNVLMSYLAMPFIALFGLTPLAVRLPNAIAGCLTLVVFWRLARDVRGKSFGICALFVLAVNPWHIMMSRWALESNQLPFWLMLGVWLTSVAKQRPWALVGAALSFALCLYAYGTAFFFLPFFLTAAVLWLRQALRPASFLCALGVFLAAALPIAACQLLNVLGRESAALWGVTLPALTESRQAATSVFGGGGVSALWENFCGLLRIVWTQSDGLSFNAMPLKYGGMFYFFGIPTAAAGLILAVRERQQRDAERPMLLWLAAAALCALFIQNNINRINMLWLPVVYYSALGCHMILCKLKSWAAIPAAGILTCLMLFTVEYRESFEIKGNASFYPGLCEAIEYAVRENTDVIYITDYVNQPYIFALFASQTPPDSFHESAVCPQPEAAFRQITAFDGFAFDAQGRAEAGILVLHRSQTQGYEILSEFGHYCVCR